jgi:hypothetical protein
MKNIEFTRGATKVSDYEGFFHGKTYYIDKTKQGYTASTGGIYCEKISARTLKDLFNQLIKVTK